MNQSRSRWAGVALVGLMTGVVALGGRSDRSLAARTRVQERKAGAVKDETLVYVGNYTKPGGADGIYVYRMDSSTGALKYASKIAGVKNPSFLAIHPNRSFLFAVNEIGDFGGKPQGAVSSFIIEAKSGELTFLNQQPTQGTAPCHISVDKTGKYLLAANYGGGNAAVFPIDADGKLGAASDFVQHQGSSVNKQRQEGPHAHSINLDAANRFVFVADLGLDKVMIYELDAQHGKLKPNKFAPTHPGAGPRHFDFHPGGKYAYVINEIDSTMTAYAYEAKKGKLTELHHLSTLPGDFTGRSSCADVHVHPNGKFVYGSNRGHDSIVIYKIDEGTGKLTLVGHESTQGKTPRNFGIDPTGKFLLAANQDTDNIVVFRVDPQTGKLTPTGSVLQSPTPVCVKFLRK